MAWSLLDWNSSRQQHMTYTQMESLRPHITNMGMSTSDLPCTCLPQLCTLSVAHFVFGSLSIVLRMSLSTHVLQNPWVCCCRLPLLGCEASLPLHLVPPAMADGIL